MPAHARTAEKCIAFAARQERQAFPDFGVRERGVLNLGFAFVDVAGVHGLRAHAGESAELAGEGIDGILRRFDGDGDDIDGARGRGFPSDRGYRAQTRAKVR